MKDEMRIVESRKDHRCSKRIARVMACVLGVSRVEYKPTSRLVGGSHFELDNATDMSMACRPGEDDQSEEQCRNTCEKGEPGVVRLVERVIKGREMKGE